MKKAQLLYGVLFIDEAHALDVESFCFLNKLLDSKFSPLILLATNRATPIDFKNSLDSKIPISFLDRCLILRTKIYSINEITNIIGLKAKNCSLLMTGNCFKELKNISLLTSLRYSILLTLSSGLVANILKKKNINSSIIKFVNFLFFFYRESRFICKSEKNYLIINRIK